MPAYTGGTMETAMMPNTTRVKFFCTKGIFPKKYPAQQKLNVQIRFPMIEKEINLM
jgi:hypothetical protein